MDLKAVEPGIDPGHQQLNDPGLLQREQFVPDFVELKQGCLYLGFIDGQATLPRRLPGLHHDLWLDQNSAQLRDDRPFDLTGCQPADRTGLWANLDDVDAAIVAIEIALAPRLGRHHWPIIGGKQQPPQQSGRLSRGCAGPGMGVGRMDRLRLLPEVL